MTRLFPLLAGLLWTAGALAQPGTPDPTFGDGGQLTLTPSATQAARAVAVLPDGQTLLAGSVEGRAAVLRLTVAGALDPSFGNGGIARLDVGGSGGLATDLAVLSNGRIVLAAARLVDGAADAGVLVGLTPSGQLDRAFGADGLVEVVAGESAVFGLDVDGEGRVLVAGLDGAGAQPSQALVARYSPDGAADPTYGTDGTAQFDVGRDGAFATDVAALSDGRAVVVGTRDVGLLGTEPFAARLTASGTLDPEFGSGGLALLDLAGSDGGLYGVAVDTQGRVVGAGAQGGTLVAIRLTATGTLDTAFGTGGVVSERFGRPRAQGTSVALQPDGKILVGGAAGTDATAELLVGRLLPDGTVDAAFGAGGAAVTPAPEGAIDVVTGLALDSFGRVVAAGYRDGPSSPSVAVRAVRLLNEGGVGLENAPTPALELAHTGPNPSHGPMRVSLSVTAPQVIRLAVYDAVGREVVVVHDGPVGAGTRTFEVAAALAPGVYTVRAEPRGAANVLLPLTVVR